MPVDPESGEGLLPGLQITAFLLCTHIAFPYSVLMRGKREREGKTKGEGEGEDGEGDRREKGSRGREIFLFF